MIKLKSLHISVIIWRNNSWLDQKGWKFSVTRYLHESHKQTGVYIRKENGVLSEDEDRSEDSGPGGDFGYMNDLILWVRPQGAESQKVPTTW